MASHLLNLLLLLSTSGCLCQKDCTGVDCPVLDKCIEEVLETEACCATCMKTGCMCEGYQYYDCTSAGFRNGKVPEGESYFVDFGSTECSCPQGGGRISCHYMPCPEIPANCIELTEPADGCIHCERFGCVHGEEKYEAGHSVQTDPCQVCHCPAGGGELMCYPIPNCDPNLIPKPVHMPAGADGTSEGLYKDHLLHVHQGSRGPISKLLPAAHNNNGPLNLHPSHIVHEEEDEEDYDYPPTDYLDPSLHDFASPTKSSIISVSNQQNFTPRQAFHKGTKQELREMLGIHKSTTDRPQFPSHKTSTDRMKISTHKDKPKENNFLKYKTDQEQFILPVETTNRVGISSRKETTQSFSLYKEHSNQEDLTDADSNTNNEHLAFPKETSEGDINNLEDGTTTTESSTTLEQTSSQLWETTASWQTAWNGVSESQIYSVLPNTVEADISKQEESITAALNQTTIHDDTQPSVVEGNKNILNSLDPVQQSVTASGIDSSQTSPEHGKSPFEPEKPSEEHKQLSATHILDHEKLIENHKHPTEELVRSSGDHKTKSERKQKWQLFSPEEFTPTSLSPNTQSHSLSNFREEQEEADNTLSSHSSMKEGSIESCCAAGQKWEEENQHCNFMPLISEDLSSVCSVVQKQCCSGALRESRCQAGINIAKAGQACEEGNSSPCGEDSHKDCCSCCALGLRLRREGKDCKAHRYLSYPCGHMFLACCEDGEEGLSPPTLKKKERPVPTATPKRVSDGPFPKQALSAGEVDPAANALEDLEHEDRCQRFGAICHHACINTHESYLCVCHPGYRLLQDARTCVPENQEEDNRVSEEDQVVTVSPAQQESSTETPVLHNPCAGNGPCAQHCSPIRGLAHCSCFPGYFLMVDGHTCEDLNECVTNTHTCQSDEWCVNTIGSFMCQRRISCSRGYQERNGVCEDIDECVVRTHNCGTGFECQNTDGSFTCEPKQRCLTGFTQDSHGNCLDIDECSSVSEPCTSGFNCINTVGSYTCQRKIIICSRGYHSSPDGARCVDVDECQTSTHRCGQGQICHNLPGSYRCDCQTGYQYDTIRKLCVDVNECWRYPGRLCAQTCENTPGSYQCSCTTGFSLAFDGKNCEDLNECDSNPCGQECANIYGSYQCYCRMGYYLKEDGHTCEDIDECSQSIGNLCAFQCENVPGSYKCACPPHGYTMSPNGRTCEDIDECAIGSHNCSASQTCFNLQGGFRCLSFTCPENYKKVSDTRCERLNCPNFQQCQTMPSRITYYQMSFQTNIVIPAQIFRIGPSPAYSGDNIIISIPRGNEEGYFSTRKLNSFTGAVYLHRQMHEPRDFLIDVEMKLLRQGTFTTFLARIYVFITPNSM